MQVLLLDADSQPLKKPDTLFELPAYKQHGNLFWRDYWTANAALEVKICQVPAKCTILTIITSSCRMQTYVIACFSGSRRTGASLKQKMRQMEFCMQAPREEIYQLLGLQIPWQGREAEWACTESGQFLYNK